MSHSTQASDVSGNGRVLTDLDAPLYRSFLPPDSSLTLPKLSRSSDFQPDVLRSQTQKSEPKSHSLWEVPVYAKKLSTDPYVPQKKTYRRSMSLENLRPIPVYIERCTSFLSAQTPKDVLKTIVDVLEEQQIDFDFNQQKNRIKAISFLQNTECSFMVNFWKFENRKKSLSSGRVIVEFHRRSGDCISFSKFFRTLLNDGRIKKLIYRKMIDLDLNGDDCFTSSFPLSSSSSSYSPFPETKLIFTNKSTTSSSSPLPVSISEQLQLDESTVSTLFEMANSRDMCAQREAVRILACASSCTKNKQKLANRQQSCLGSGSGSSSSSSSTVTLLTLLASLLQSSDFVIGRNAAVLLKNMTEVKENDFRLQIIHSLLSQMISLLALESSLSTLDLKRHLVSSLNKLSETHAHVLRKRDESERLIEILQKCNKNEDDELQSSVATTLQRLKVSHVSHHSDSAIVA